MSHKRPEIRAYIADILKKRIQFSNTVFTNRKTNLFPEELPAVFLHTPSEDVEVFAAAPRILLRHLTVVVEVAARGDDLDDRLDAHASAIEKALAPEERLGGLTRDLVLTKTETDLDVSGDALLGSVRLTYVATYLTDEMFAAPLEAFKHAFVRLV